MTLMRNDIRYLFRVHRRSVVRIDRYEAMARLGIYVAL